MALTHNKNGKLVFIKHLLLSLLRILSIVCDTHSASNLCRQHTVTTANASIRRKAGRVVNAKLPS